MENILSNGKYKGDALLQKCCTVDFLSKKRKANEGGGAGGFQRETVPPACGLRSGCSTVPCAAAYSRPGGPAVMPHMGMTMIFWTVSNCRRGYGILRQRMQKNRYSVNIPSVNKGPLGFAPQIWDSAALLSLSVRPVRRLTLTLPAAKRRYLGRVSPCSLRVRRCITRKQEGAVPGSTRYCQGKRYPCGKPQKTRPSQGKRLYWQKVQRDQSRRRGNLSAVLPAAKMETGIM